MKSKGQGARGKGLAQRSSSAEREQGDNSARSPALRPIGLRGAGHSPLLGSAGAPQAAALRFGSDCRGSVLVIVLVTLVFVTFALLAFMHRASGDLIVATREADAKTLRKDAYSALELTLAVLSSYMQSNNGILRSPEEGWKDPLGFAEFTPPEGQTIEITFEDESGKIPLPNVDANMLLAMLKSWEIEDNDAQEITDALMTWMRPNYTPATAFIAGYDAAPIPYAPPTRSLRSYNELAAIDKVRDHFYGEDGRPNDLWRRFAASFSLYNYTRPNINAAPADVLVALASLDQTQTDAVLEARTGTEEKEAGYFTGQAAVAPLVGQANLGGFNYQISALRVNVIVREGRASYRLSALLAPLVNGQPAAQIVAAAATNTTGAASGTQQAGGRAGQPGQAQPGQQGRGGQAGQGAAAGGTTNPSINYPFTVLEFHEDTVAPPPEAKTEE